jgi:hypothetical protein
MKISTYVFTRILAYDNFVYIFTDETVMQRTPLKGDQYEVRRQNGFARNENKAIPNVKLQDESSYDNDDRNRSLLTAYRNAAAGGILPDHEFNDWHAAVKEIETPS